MRKLLLACIMMMLVPATAGASSIQDVGQTQLTVVGLTCGTKYRVRVEVRNSSNTGWTGLQTFTPTTAACDPPPPPPPPPADADGDGVPDSTDACPGTPAGTTVDSTGCPVTTPPPSGFPDASNTGVPAGTTLTTYTGSCTISTANAVIDSKTINCPNGLSIQAANVTIKNSKVNAPILVDTDVNRSWSLNLTDSEVDGGPNDGASIANGNVTILRANIHGGHNGLECQEHGSFCSMTDSWVHDQYIPAGSVAHLGGVADFGRVVTCSGPAANGVPSCIALVHNRIVCDAAVTSAGGGCTGDINLLTQWGPLHGALIKDNYLGANTGASYCTYGGFNSSQASDHIVYTGNIFARGTNRQCAAYGPVTNFDVNGSGNVWTGNVWDDGGTVTPSL